MMVEMATCVARALDNSGSLEIHPGSYKTTINSEEGADLRYWDCSKQGFEGIRAQDILPLLVKKFSFRSFLGFGNC